MNYPKEHREFHDWLETNQPGKAAIALWHALMGVCNKARWPQKFTVAISVLEGKTGFKRSELFEARKALQTMGRIRWANRGGNLAAEYEIIPFCVHTADTAEQPEADSIRIADTKPLKKQTVSAIRTPKHTQKHTQTGTINKHKQNTVESSAAEPPPPPKFQKPTIEELTAFFTEKVQEKKLGWHPDRIRDKAETFINHYNSNGWKVGKAGMKDWKAAVCSTWLKNEKYSTNHATATTYQSTDYEKARQRTVQLAGQ